MQIRPFVVAIALCLCAGAAAAHEYTALFKAKKFAEAEQAINAKLQRDPRDADALIARSQLITIMGAQGRYEEAARLAEQCAAAHPNNSDCYVALGDATAARVMAGSALTAMSSASKIRDAYLKALAISPLNMAARFNLMQYYLMAPSMLGGGKDKIPALIAETSRLHADAGKLLQASLDATSEHYAGAEALTWSVNPGNNEDLQQIQRSTLFRLGGRFLQDKKYPDSERIYRDMQKRFPQDALGYFGQARLLQEQGRCTEALPLFDKALLFDARASVYYAQAQCLVSSNEAPRALQAFERALAARPGLNKTQLADAEKQVAILKTRTGRL